MTYDEFQRHIGKAGLKLYEFAYLLEMNPTSISNKRTRGVPRHLAVIAALMGEMADHGLDFRVVLSRIDILPKDLLAVELDKASDKNN